MPALLVTSLPRLVDSLRQAPIVRLGDYDYFLHPLTDGFPRIEPALLQEVAEALARLLPPAVDRLLTPEAMGLPITTALAQRAGLPYTVARKRTYGLPGEVTVPYRTGYAQGAFSLNGLRAGERVVLVDDVVSRGGTLRALVEGVRRCGARVEKVLLVVNKSADLAALGRELGCPLEALADVAVRGGRLEVLGAR